MSSLNIELLTIRFGAFDAVQNVSLSVAEGEMVSLLGPSGCGKSTILRAIAGLNEPSSGKITVGSQLLNDSENGVFVAPERRELGMVFQSYAVWPHMTVFENVSYPLKVRKAPKSEIADRTHAVLKLVGLQDKANRPATDLSGGQQQRIAIARSLVFSPRLLLMDEPLSNLDAKLRMRVGVELKHIQERTGITTVYVTHDQTEALSLSDKIAVLNGGRIEQFGPPAEIYNSPVSPFVSWFIGSSNFIPARAEAERDESFRVVPDGTNVSISVRPVPPELDPNEPVMVFARPEHVGLTNPGAPGAISVQIVSGSYLGERWLWIAQLGDVQIEFYTSPSQRLERGATVWISFENALPTAFAKSVHGHFAMLHEEHGREGQKPETGEFRREA